MPQLFPLYPNGINHIWVSLRGSIGRIYHFGEVYMIVHTFPAKLVMHVFILIHISIQRCLILQYFVLNGYCFLPNLVQLFSCLDS